MNNLFQLVVSYNKSTLSVLERKGYKNVQKLSTDNYMFPVIIADLKDKTFFGTNTTCMAAMSPKVYNVEDVIDIL